MGLYQPISYEPKVGDLIRVKKEVLFLPREILGKCGLIIKIIEFEGVHEPEYKVLIEDEYHYLLYDMEFRVLRVKNV